MATISAAHIQVDGVAHSCGRMRHGEGQILIAMLTMRRSGAEPPGGIRGQIVPTMLAGFRGLLSHPLTKDLDLDDPRLPERRVQVPESQAFLRRIYDES